MASSSSSSSSYSSSSSDQELLQQAALCMQEERLLQAARLLRQVQDKRLINNDPHYQKMLSNAAIVEEAVKELLTPPSSSSSSSSSENHHHQPTDDHHEDGWKKQGESHGRYDTSIYYKVQSGARLTCRAESPIPASLLVPLLSVLNESSLYHTWIPSWTRPVKLGVRQSKQIMHDTRGHQVIQVQCDVPWPLKAREVVFDVVAVDDIDANGSIIAKMRTLEERGLLPEGFVMPPLEYGMERAEFDGAVLFRACPPDHPHYLSSQQKFPNEELVLLQFSIYFDAHMSMVPQSAINFMTRTVIGHVWNMLLHVAEQVRDDGSSNDSTPTGGRRRPPSRRAQHRQAIVEKAEFYKWVQERCQVMLQSKIPINNCTTTTTTSSTQKSNNSTNTTSTSSISNNGTVTTSTNTTATTSPSCRQETSDEDSNWTMHDILRVST